MPAVAPADVVWDEDIDGDLSGTQASPDTITLSAGTNSLLATSSPGDIEYVTVTVPAAHEFSELVLASYVSTDDVSFIGFAAGPVIPNEAPGPPGTLLGYVHFGAVPGHVGTDILPDMALGAGAMGFTPPLDSGQYAFWIQQASGPVATYQFDFIITALAGTPGDYNGNGTVDAADYALWRDNEGTAGPDGDGTGWDGANLTGVPDGIVDEHDYEYWRAHFGETSGSGAGAAAIPEPTSIALAGLALLSLVVCARRSLRSGRAVTWSSS